MIRCRFRILARDGQKFSPRTVDSMIPPVPELSNWALAVVILTLSPVFCLALKIGTWHDRRVYIIAGSLPDYYARQF